LQGGSVPEADVAFVFVANRTRPKPDIDLARRVERRSPARQQAQRFLDWTPRVALDDG